MTQNKERTMRQMAELQAKKTRLEDLFALMPYDKATFFFYGKDGTFVSLDQSMLPFSMVIEMGILIDSSIQYYEEQIKELSNYL
jgi:hypothetical protein